MKNRKKLRTMQIGHRAYYWVYYYDDMDFVNYPYSYYLLIPKHNKGLKVRIYFRKYEPPMNLNVYNSQGVLCFYQGQQVALNLCCPRYARQVIEYVFSHCCLDTDQGKITLEDGEAILEQLGYSDFYR